MRQAWWLLAVVALSLASCRARQGQTAGTVVDPFLIQRSTTIAPPQTGTVTPLGTIQPFDTTTPALPPGTTLPPPGQPAGQPFPPGTTLPYSTPTSVSTPLLPSTAPGATTLPGTSSGVSFAGGANGLPGNSSGSVQQTSGSTGGRATTAGWTTPIAPSSASPSVSAPATLRSTDISNLPPVRR